MRGQHMRVLHVLGELRPSGAESMLLAAGPIFHSHGVQGDVLSTGVFRGPLAERFEAAGYRVHHIPFSRSFDFFRREAALIRTERYDVIHIHCERANFWHALVALVARGMLVLRTVHSSFHFQGGLRLRRGVQRRLLASFGVNHISISDSVRRSELEHFGLTTTLVWNWFDSRRFTRTESDVKARARNALKIRNDAFVLVSVGNCSAIKNHSAILHAIATLPPEERPYYLHVGSEEPGFPERALADRLGVSGCVRFLGALDDVLPILRAADAYIMPSLNEGFSVAALEALGVGLPTLFSDVAGLRDLREFFPSLVYTDTSPGAVAQGLRALASMSDATKADINRRYPDIADRQFGIERGVLEYVALYGRGPNEHVKRIRPSNRATDSGA